jgi:hypothetical protein
MTDHWNFVAAAYGLAVVVLGGYWRRLVKKERELMTAGDERNRPASMSGHPRSVPASRHPLQK